MQPELRDNPQQQRFEMDVDGGVAFVRYAAGDDGVLQLLHAEVPFHLRGRGTGNRLVRKVLEWARERERKVVPYCSFIAIYMRRHSEFHDLLAR